MKNRISISFAALGLLLAANGLAQTPAAPASAASGTAVLPAPKASASTSAVSAETNTAVVEFNAKRDRAISKS